MEAVSTSETSVTFHQTTWCNNPEEAIFISVTIKNLKSHLSQKMAVFWVYSGRNFYQTTRRYNPEDSHLHTHRRENLKSYSSVIV
jgi:hypothetical protein